MPLRYLPCRVPEHDPPIGSRPRRVRLARRIIARPVREGRLVHRPRLHFFPSQGGRCGGPTLAIASARTPLPQQLHTHKTIRLPTTSNVCLLHRAHDALHGTNGHGARSFQKQIWTGNMQCIWSLSHSMIATYSFCLDGKTGYAYLSSLGASRVVQGLGFGTTKENPHPARPCDAPPTGQPHCSQLPWMSGADDLLCLARLHAFFRLRSSMLFAQSPSTSLLVVSSMSSTGTTNVGV